MIYLAGGYLLGAGGTFVWVVSQNWAYCSNLEDCLLTLVWDIAWGVGWPIYWFLEYY